MIKASQLEHVDDLEAAAIKLRAFIDRVKGASHGYAGLFDHVSINSDELEKIYQYDLSMLENVNRIANAIDNVSASLETDGLPAALRNLETISQESVDAFNRRDEVLLAP
jgi:methyl-accepting chemotaxis protein